MKKIIVKLTVSEDADPELYGVICNVPSRRRGSVLRRICRQGLLKPAIQKPEDARSTGGSVVRAGVDEIAVNVTIGPRKAGNDLLRRDLNGQDMFSGMSVFE